MRSASASVAWAMALPETFLRRKMDEYETLRTEIASLESDLDQIKLMKTKQCWK